MYRGADRVVLEVLQGSNDVEKSPSSKRAPAVGCNNERQAFRNGIRMDDQREYQRVHQGQPRRGPVRACGVSLLFLTVPSTNDVL